LKPDVLSFRRFRHNDLSAIRWTFVLKLFGIEPVSRPKNGSAEPGLPHRYRSRQTPPAATFAFQSAKMAGTAQIQEQWHRPAEHRPGPRYIYRLIAAPAPR
jgi:hypothetical protein